jgi:diketogulonate reductase-like aldo/keto reductase
MHCQVQFHKLCTTVNRDMQRGQSALQMIGEEVDRSSAQVILKWALQSGMVRLRAAFHLCHQPQNIRPGLGEFAPC